MALDYSSPFMAGHKLNPSNKSRAAKSSQENAARFTSGHISYESICCVSNLEAQFAACADYCQEIVQSHSGAEQGGMNTAWQEIQSIFHNAGINRKLYE